MRTIDYDKDDKNSGGTETHMAVDEEIAQSESLQTAFNEGFASASGIRSETAETGGRITNGENADRARVSQIRSSVEDENAGLADN